MAEKFYTIDESLAMTARKLELGYLSSKLELYGLDFHESIKFDFLVESLSLFYGVDKRQLLKSATEDYAIDTYKKLLGGTKDEV